MSMTKPRTAWRTKARLSRTSNGRLMTPEEFDAVTDYDEQYCYELIRGVLIVNRPLAESEADANEELGCSLRSYQESNPQGSTLDKTLPQRYVHLPNSRRQPERVIWTGLGRLPDSTKDVPSIAVEFVSKQKRDWIRDYVEKRREYREIGIKEYWIFDRFQRTLTVCYVDGRERVVAENETYQTDLLPGFVLPLARLLTLANQWDQPKKKRRR